MNRRNFVRAAAMVPLAAGCSQLALGAFGENASPGEAGLDGVSMARGQTPMRERYELTLRRVLSGGPPAYTPEFLLADVRPVAERRFTEFSGDLSGRYIGALASAAAIYKADFAGLDALVGKVIALQKPDGFFGESFSYDKPTDQDLALLWGNGRLLVGLIEYYRLRPSVPVLAACKKLGDFLVRIGSLMLSKEMREEFGAKHFASSYICWMQQTEGLVGLYGVTKDERYRKLAEEIAAVIERRPGDHVHGYLTSLRGVMDLYGATGDRRFLEQCETAWMEISSSKDLLMTGGVPEGWSPNNHRTEGCAEVDWVRLNLQLWKATEKQQYLDAAERAIFNELAFNQFETGDFGHRLYTDTGLPGNGSARAWWCCTLHGLRCFPDIHASAFGARKDGVYFDLPIDGRIETPSLSAISDSSLSQDGKIRIRITAARAEPVALAFRKPEWADTVDIHTKASGNLLPIEHGYVGVSRAWSAGDVIEVKYAMKLRSTRSASNRTAYWYGPWLLGASSTDNPEYFNELTADNRLVAGKEDGIQAAPEPARRFRVPVAATVVPCIHAEFPDQPGTVELRAIAEQTGMPTTSWELLFLTQERG